MARARANHSAATRFAALGDATRLRLVSRLCGAPRSTTQLSRGARISRQAITKHLRVLEGAGLVRSVRHGRERLFELCPEPLGELRAYLAEVSRQWDDALERLRAFVEE